jgi:hypothetical protein
MTFSDGLDVATYLVGQWWFWAALITVFSLIGMFWIILTKLITLPLMVGGKILSSIKQECERVLKEEGIVHDDTPKKGKGCRKKLTEDAR